MVEAIPLVELGFPILILPPISRASHFLGRDSGPELYAGRLVELWQVADGEHVPLAQAFRLLDVSDIAGAVLRGMAEIEHEGDPLYWTFPTFEELLPELRELAWQRMLAGSMLVEGIKGIRGKRHRSVLPAELPRLAPDWGLSRLTRDGRDDFIDVRVRRTPATPIKVAWRDVWSKAELQAGMKAIERTYPPDARPPFGEILTALRARFPGLPRDVGRKLVHDYALRLVGQRGRRSTKSPS